MGCDHIGLFTNNADRLVEFYHLHLGFEVVKEEELSTSMVRRIFGFPGACRFIKLSADPDGAPHPLMSSLVLEIFQPLESRLARRRNGAVGCNHWGLVVRDRSGLAGAMRRKRVPVTEVVRGERRIFFIRDPDGNRIELRE